jgi:hypothetical protein
MMTKEEADSFDEVIRASLVARKEELGLSDSALGKLAFFGHVSMPKGKIQSIFSGQGAPGKRKPQNIRAADLMNLCEALWKMRGKKVKENEIKFISKIS